MATQSNWKETLLLESRQCRFKSYRSYQIYTIAGQCSGEHTYLLKKVRSHPRNEYSSLWGSSIIGNAPLLQSEDCGFNSHLLHHFKLIYVDQFQLYINHNALVAQLVERIVANDKVVGSYPTQCSILILCNQKSLFAPKTTIYQYE